MGNRVFAYGVAVIDGNQAHYIAIAKIAKAQGDKLDPKAFDPSVRTVGINCDLGNELDTYDAYCDAQPDVELRSISHRDPDAHNESKLRSPGQVPPTHAGDLTSVQLTNLQEAEKSVRTAGRKIASVLSDDA